MRSSGGKFQEDNVFTPDIYHNRIQKNHSQHLWCWEEIWAGKSNLHVLLKRNDKENSWMTWMEGDKILPEIQVAFSSSWD